jgi:ribonuclease HII
MQNRFQKESALYNSGARQVIGVDEAGRGPLAGPVVAAAVWFASPTTETWWDEIRDSKKLSEARREQLAQKILEYGSVGVGTATVAEIEQHNILQASLVAMHRAVNKLDDGNFAESPRVILVDGKFVISKLQNYRQEAVVHGDELVHSIAAASIVAKVARDNIMKDLATKFPEYGFEQHKGYGTAAHIAAIEKYGLSPVHRISFCGNIVS